MRGKPLSSTSCKDVLLSPKYFFHLVIFKLLRQVSDCFFVFFSLPQAWWRRWSTRRPRSAATWRRSWWRTLTSWCGTLGARSLWGPPGTPTTPTLRWGTLWRWEGAGEALWRVNSHSGSWRVCSAHRRRHGPPMSEVGLWQRSRSERQGRGQPPQWVAVHEAASRCARVLLHQTCYRGLKCVPAVHVHVFSYLIRHGFTGFSVRSLSFLPDENKCCRSIVWTDGTGLLKVLRCFLAEAFPFLNALN